MDDGDSHGVAKVFLWDSPALDGDGVADCARRGFRAKAVPKKAIQEGAQIGDLVAF